MTVIMKKMSVGGMNGVRGGFKNITEPTFAARIFGITRSVEIKPTNFGNSLCFKGMFEGINAEGEIHKAAICYLVAPADQMLADELNKPENAGKEITFSFDFFVIPKEKRGPQDLGYEYQVRPLVESKPSDAMSALKSAVTLALPSKKSEPQGTLQLVDDTAGTQTADPEKMAEKIEAEIVEVKPAKTHGKK